MKHVNIDADGKKLGHLAVSISNILNGKDSADFAKNKVPEVCVVIKNCSKLDITNKKQKTKIYQRYSGYPGGRKTRTMVEETQVNGFESVLRHAVSGMLPKNKLKSIKLRRLTISE